MRQGTGSDRGVAEDQQQQTSDRRNARLAKEQYEKERQRRLDLEAKTKAQASSLQAEEKRCRMLQVERDRVVDEVESLKRQLKELRYSHGELEQLASDMQTKMTQQEISLGSYAPCPQNGVQKPTLVNEAAQNTDQQLDQETASSYQQHFLRQRELLIRLIRKGALLEEEKMTLSDDV